ncbi:MAG: YeeE/YedE family protein [Ekhidna sp.]
MIEFISQPWPWYVAGPLIALIMFSLLYFGKTFGLSSNLRTMCSILGAGKNCEFFNFDWKSQTWNLVFVLGLIIGGWISNQWLTTDAAVALSPDIQAELLSFGINPASGLTPSSIFSWESLTSLRGVVMIVIGGFFVGFGTRYAGGCTSGHAISGLSNLQLPSLIAVIGFFIGGLFVTYIVLPHLLTI